MDPLRLLVGEGLAYGQPLPSQQAAADAYLEDPEVAVGRSPAGSTAARDGRLVGEALAARRSTAPRSSTSRCSTRSSRRRWAPRATAPRRAETIAGRPVLHSQRPVGHGDGLPRGQPAHARAGPRRPRRPRGRGAPAAGARGRGGRRGGAVHAARPAPDRRRVRAGADGDVPADPAAGGGAATGAARACRVPPRCRVATAWSPASAARPCGPTRSTPAPTRAPSRSSRPSPTLVSARAGGAPAETTEVLGRVVLARRRPRGQPVGPRLPPPGPRRSSSRASTPPSSTPSSPPGSPRCARLTSRSHRRRC